MRTLIPVRHVEEAGISISLLCVMESYVRPNEDFQWSKDSIGIIPTNGEGNYAILHSSFSSPDAQGENGSFATVSVLAISDVQLEHGGNYTCGIIGTQQVAHAEIVINFGKLNCILYYKKLYR